MSERWKVGHVLPNNTVVTGIYRRYHTSGAIAEVILSCRNCGAQYNCPINNYKKAICNCSRQPGEVGTTSARQRRYLVFDSLEYTCDYQYLAGMGPALEDTARRLEIPGTPRYFVFKSIENKQSASPYTERELILTLWEYVNNVAPVATDTRLYIPDHWRGYIAQQTIPKEMLLFALRRAGEPKIASLKTFGRDIYYLANYTNTAVSENDALWCRSKAQYAWTADCTFPDCKLSETDLETLHPGKLQRSKADKTTYDPPNPQDLERWIDFFADKYKSIPWDRRQRDDHKIRPTDNLGQCSPNIPCMQAKEPPDVEKPLFGQPPTPLTPR